ncbi:hypothetical protein MMC11_007121 [Xylographa trunciseda]|nr:hypothetical protein [Xylographa trunciseda]
MLSPRSDRLPRPTAALIEPPTTPHAIRALEQRRAAMRTPARGRRRSGRQYRETPRDTLRDLSKILSKTTNPIATASEIVHNPRLSDTLSKRAFPDNEDDRPRPRLSMPFDEIKENADSLQAPRTGFSVLSEEHLDVERSIEKPRRAFSERPLSRLSRGSLGSFLINDHASDTSKPKNSATIDQHTDGGDMIDQVENKFEDENLDEVNGLGTDIEDLRQMADHVSNGRLSPLTEGEVPSILGDDDNRIFGLGFPENPDRSGHFSNSNLNYSTGTSRSSSPGKHRGSDLSPGCNEVVSSRIRTPKPTIMSRHGIQCPRIPISVINKLSTSLARSIIVQNTKMNKDTLSALLEASDWFFEQIGTDLGTYAKHARRKIVDETDVVVLMKRQRLLTAQTTPFFLAQRYLPSELLQDIRMAPLEDIASKRRRSQGFPADEDYKD